MVICCSYKLVNLSFNLFFILPWQKNARVVSIDGFEDVPENDENSLKKAVAHQPVSVAIEAGGRAFQLYQSVNTQFYFIIGRPDNWRLVSLIFFTFLYSGCIYWSVWNEPRPWCGRRWLWHRRWRRVLDSEEFMGS